MALVRMEERWRAARAMVPLDVGRMQITITNVVTIVGILPLARGS